MATEIEMLEKAQRRRDRLAKRIKDRRTHAAENDILVQNWKLQLQRECEHISRIELLLMTANLPVESTVARTSSAPSRLSKRSSKGGSVSRLSSSARKGSSSTVRLGKHSSSRGKNSNSMQFRELLSLRQQWDKAGRPVHGMVYKQLKTLAEKL